MAQTIQIKEEAEATQGHIRAKRAFVAINKWRKPTKDLTVLHAGETQKLPENSHIKIFTGGHVYDVHTASKATITGPVAFTPTKNTTTTAFQRWNADVESVDGLTGGGALVLFIVFVLSFLIFGLSESASAALLSLCFCAPSGLGAFILYRSASAFKRIELNVPFDHKELKKDTGGMKFKRFLSPRPAPQDEPLNTPAALEVHTRLDAQPASAQSVAA